MANDFLEEKISGISLEEKERVENEIRSNLRYVWQKLTTYIIYYKPSVLEIIQQLEESFLHFIPKDYFLKEAFKKVINSSFSQILPDLKKARNLFDIDLENKFIDITISNLKKITV